MAKKRKAPTKTQESSDAIELDPHDSRKRIRTYEQVADSDEDFHLNQDEIRLAEAPDARRQRKWAEQESFLQASDEEILGFSEDDASDLELVRHGRHSESPEDEDRGRDNNDDEDEDEVDLHWGTSKADLYGADRIETEEQALEEEAEGIRLQKKQLQALQAADYGFDASEWQEAKDEDAAAETSVTVTEVLPHLQIAPDLGSTEKLKLLKSRYPEFDPLSKDLVRLAEAHGRLREVASSSRTAQTKLKAVSAYIGALVMYFSLLTSPAVLADGGMTAMPAAQLREHPVMESLLRARQVWNEIEAVPEEAQTSDVNDALRGNADENMGTIALSNGKRARGTAITKQLKKSRAQIYAEAVEAEAEKRSSERMRKTEADLAGLEALIGSVKPSKINSRKRRQSSVDSDMDEDAPLTAREAAEKAQKKKSLRFYTSQIAQKSNKRGAAGRNAGGDDDIPYRERLKDRQARLNAEAEKRGKRLDEGSADLGAESDEEDHRQAQQIRAQVDEEDYYDLVASRAAKKKSEKAALAAAQREAARQGGHVVQEEAVGLDGKRKISYAIEKNKGLTPHRKKDVRNPRVKKRKKFDEKKKKLASIKPVYKGGEGRGGYAGELTGIKKGLVKSTKL